MSAEPEERAHVLELDHLSLSFGGLRALSELDLQVGDREVVSVIGPNGAGKTTVFNVITGVYEPSSGDVRFGGESIAGKPPHVIARLGIARTFQTLRLFLNMSVIENVTAARRIPLGPAGLLAVVREPAAAGNRPGACLPAQAAAAGRAGRRDESRRDARGHRADRAAA